MTGSADGVKRSSKASRRDPRPEVRELLALEDPQPRSAGALRPALPFVAYWTRRCMNSNEARRQRICETLTRSRISNYFVGPSQNKPLFGLYW